MREKKFIIILFFILTAFSLTAFDDPTGNPDKRKIDLSQTTVPMPHINEVANPVAMYNTVTEELSVTLDAVHYSDYTITLVSGLIEVDYYPFSPVVCMPTASMGDVVTIYIESDDCGSWYGELDKAYFGGPISN